MILDTNAISALLEDDEAIHARIATERTLYLPVIAIGEFRFGLLGSRLRERLTEKLAALIRDCVVLDVDRGDYLALRRVEARTQGRRHADSCKRSVDRSLGSPTCAAHSQPRWSFR